MKKVARLTLSILSIDPGPTAFRPKFAKGVRAYARATKIIGFAIKARARFGAPYSTSIGIAFFLALITASALLPACSPCRIAMYTVPSENLGCTDSGVRISECVVPECRTDAPCDQPTRWKATCKKDGREFDCEKYPRKDGRCFK